MWAYLFENRSMEYIDVYAINLQRLFNGDNEITSL